jgi:23S rRNA pseudouridine1911/1915/1917 synthase
VSDAPRRADGERWIVDAASAGVRLDKFLAAAGRLGSRGRAADALARRKVFLNGSEAAPADAARPLSPDDDVRVWMDRPGTSRRPRSIGEARDLRIVYQDDYLVVLDKPPGVLAVPLARREGARSVLDDLQAHLKTRERGRRVYVVHRIDRDTSGLVLFAKTARAQDALKAQFKRHEPERVYVAVVYGRPHPASGTWSDRLVWDERALVQKETHPRDPRGKDAVCRYRVLEDLGRVSVVEVSLVTGRRNQIRLQARLHGHMLVGERRYTFGPDSLRPIPFPRQALHAHRLVFAHPATGREMRFEAPLPEDMAGLIERCRAARSGAPRV